MPRPSRFTPSKDPVPVVLEAGWAHGPVCTGAENLIPIGFDPRTIPPITIHYTEYAVPTPHIFFVPL